MFSLYANWKSYKNIVEARAWFDIFRESLSSVSRELLRDEQLEVVIFPPAPLAYPLHILSIDMPGIGVGIQDISPYSEGKHTGLISTRNIEGVATHVMVGHAETRERGDTDETISRKYEQVLGSRLTPVLCVSKHTQIIPGAQIITYEPLEAIGSGNNADPGNVLTFAHKLSHKHQKFIYGGSVNADNCVQYLRPRICDGFLVGQVSLDALDFASLVNTCASYGLD